MKKRVNLINRVSALGLSFFLALGSITPAFSISANAEAVEVLNGATTVADMIFSYCASGGIVIVNESAINEVYQELGSSYGTIQTFVDNGLLTTVNGQYIDTGLSTSINSVIQNITSLDIGSLFNQTASQNPSGVALTAGGTLAGIAGGVATTGVLPLVVGVAIEGWAGFQLGTLIANAIGLYGPCVYAGQPINMAEYVDGLPAGYTVFTSSNDTNNQTWACLGSNVFCSYKSSTSPVKYSGILVFKYGNVNENYTLYKKNHRTGASSNVSMQYRDGIGTITLYNIQPDCTNQIVFDNIDDARTYVQAIKDGINPIYNSYSPDIIGYYGNIQANYDSESGYTIPDVLPQIDPSTQSVNPAALTLEDWLRFANDAKGNYTNGNPDLNADIFDDILDAIRGYTPTPTPNPTPGPTPDPTPDPGGETYPVPGPVPDTTPVPDPEYQPETKPQPQYTEKATENETDITEGDPWTTPDLLNKFPFCIPRDVYRVFTKLDAGGRSAPHVQWRFHPNNMIDYTFDIDFAEWDSIATLLRTLELLGFIVALAVATRRMILS